MQLDKFRQIKEASDEKLVDIHHELMKFYHCWIPIKELKKTPIPTILGLIERINKERRKPEPMPVVIMGFAKGRGRLG